MERQSPGVVLLGKRWDRGVNEGTQCGRPEEDTFQMRPSRGL
jgi:hypothetical protein